MSAAPAVIVEKKGHILTVTLNRPEKKNCVNSEVMCRLVDPWIQLDEDLSELGLKPVLRDSAFQTKVEAATHALHSSLNPA